MSCTTGSGRRAGDQLGHGARPIGVREQVRFPPLQLDVRLRIDRLPRRDQAILEGEDALHPLGLVELLHPADDEVGRVHVQLEGLAEPFRRRT